MLTNQQIRAIYLYEFKLGNSAADATRNINKAFGDGYVAESTTRWWFAKFRLGKFDLSDAEGRGRKTSVDNDGLKTIIESNPQNTVRNLSKQLSVSISTVSQHLKEIGKVKKLNKWIPHLLTYYQKQMRYDICSKLIQRNKNNPFLRRIITCDEKWILYDNRKRASEWVDRGSVPKCSPKPSLHPKKILISVWWCQTGLIHYEFLKKGESITSDVYCNQLERMHQKLKVLHPAIVNRNIPILLHDNARPHVAKQTLQKVNDLGYEILPHPAYSPDLSPTDYYLFQALHYFLSGKVFNSYDTVKQVFEEFVVSRKHDFYEKGILSLQSRWEQCIKCNGNYF